MPSLPAEASTIIGGVTRQENNGESTEAPVPLFKLGEYHAAGTRFLGEAIEALARAQHPLFAKIPVAKVEGPIDGQITTDEGEEVELLGGMAGAPLAWHLTDIMICDFDELLASVDAAGKAYADSVIEMLYRQILTVTETTGNVQQLTGPLTWDVILDSLEQIEWSFDREGNPNFPDIVHGPNVEVPPMEPRHNERLGEIVERKRQEHRAARGSRRFP